MTGMLLLTVMALVQIGASRHAPAPDAPRPAASQPAAPRVAALRRAASQEPAAAQPPESLPGESQPPTSQPATSDPVKSEPPASPAGLLSQPPATPATVDPPTESQPTVTQPLADPSAVPPPRPSFVEWLAGVRSEALSRGIRGDIVDAALSGVVEPLPVVIERDRSQAEAVLPLETYIARRLSPAFLRTGKEKYARYQAMLARIAATYGVPGPIVASIWGIESNFGRFSGVRPTITALATLAWDPRRSTYFRSELFSALEILNRGDIEPAMMRGSWAGAMGQPQFMPSSYLQYAEDYDGDGRRDIWSTPADIFASVANYLKGHGWIRGQLWGREVSVSKQAASRVASTVARRAGSCQATRDMTVALPLAEWQRLGVRTVAGGPMPKADLPASLVSGRSRFFLVYKNYDALLQYNCAHAYALSVALMSDRLGR